MMKATRQVHRMSSALGSGLLLASALLGGHAMAAETAMEEVVVTARHRAENMQSVPIAMTAVSGTDIRDGRITSLQGLEHSVPNLVFGETGSSGETHIGIRGIGDFSRNIGFDTRVGVYIDGVFAGQSLAVDQGLVDVERVEVLRGPQGTLFGKNSSSGAINIVSNKPEMGVRSADIRLGAGSLDTVTGHLIANVPVGDKSAARFSLVSQQRDGYIHNLFNGKDLMTDDHTLGRFRLRFQPTAAMDINFSYDFRRQKNDLLFLEPDAAFENTMGNPAAAGRFTVDQDADLIDENDGAGAGLTVDYELDSGHVLTSITGFRAVDRKVGSDEDATSAFALHVRYFEDDFEHFTQELRLASPGSEDLRYVVGLFYFDQDATTDRRVVLGPAFGGPPDGVEAATQDSSVDTSNFAAFGNATWDISGKWTLSGGLRYTKEEKDAEIDQFVFPGFGLAESVDESLDRDEDYFTSTLNLRYAINNDVQTYFKFSNGYKAGGFNVDLVPTVDDLFFEEETVDSFELGLKSELLDGRLRLNMAAFHAEYDDYQVFQFRFNPLTGTTALLISNAASVTTRGVEIEGVARISANFEVDYGLGYTHAEFDDFPGGAIDPVTGETLNVRGNTLPRAPELTGSVTARYHFAAGFASGVAALNYTWRGEQFFNPDNRENSKQDGYGLLNASLDLDLDSNWSVGVWGRNLTDEVYRGMRGTSFQGIPFSLYMQPRTWGVEVAFRY